MEILITVFALLTLLGVLAFTLDDFFLDAAGIIAGVGPVQLTPNELKGLAVLTEKRFAILVANWKEEDVIEAMVRGNLSRIRYENYSIFLGVYPNDLPTFDAAKRLESLYPQVTVVVNERPGPTTKGQLLNFMIRQILESEQASGFTYEAFLLHDSEDLIHPLSLRLMNRELDQADFVQIPVFSLLTPYTELTAGSYADEFAEAHLKSLMAREVLGAAVPSAGVGTAVSRNLVRAFLAMTQGSLLSEETVTEDYQLGLLAGRLGFRTHFACVYVMNEGKRDFIATREFFPHQVKTSIRQKTRWVVGIAFQGWKNLGWGQSASERYFLWRDRRGPLNGVLIVASTLLLAGFAAHWAILHRFPDVAYYSAFSFLFWVNFAQMVWRMILRVRHTSMVYGLAFGLMAPLRWPLANYINCVAAWCAYRTFRDSQKRGRAIAWVKTQHRLPVGFGQEQKQEKEYAQV